MGNIWIILFNGGNCDFTKKLPTKIYHYGYEKFKKKNLYDLNSKEIKYIFKKI